MNSIILFGELNASDYTVMRFNEEASKKGLIFKHYKYSKLWIDYTGDSTIINSSEDRDIITSNDAFIFRSSNGVKGNFRHLAGILRKLVNSAGKKTLNQNISHNHFNEASKMYNQTVMLNAGIPVIPSIVLTNEGQIDLIKKYLSYPFIAKVARSSHGEGVFLIKEESELRELIKKQPLGTILLQEFIDTSANSVRSDIRVITVGNEIIGAFKRVSPDSQIATNIGAGGVSDSFDLDDATREVVNKIINTFEPDYAGIDIIYKEGKPMVLEINNSPQFEEFEKATGVNLVSRLLQQLTK